MRGAIRSVSGRDHAIIWGCLAALVALAWGYLVWLDLHMASSGMHDGVPAAVAAPALERWHSADIGFTFAMWVVMMVGMMAPSAAPMILLFAATQAPRQEERSASWSVVNFAIGYLAVWAGFSALATLAQWALHDAALLSPQMATSNVLLGGAILAAAGAYQWTPMKRVCLAKCQSPLGFFATHWRAGASGALRMGVDHGFYCLGCCWALMALLFVVGVMNLLWVVLLTLLVLLEKVATAGQVIARIAGVALIAGGVAMMIGSG
jgi:predicted metal-binding membrane protein